MVPVDGGRVWARVNGDLDADAAPAILVHRGSGGTHMCFGQMLPLADQWAVIPYDQRDSGKTDHPG